MINDFESMILAQKTMCLKRYIKDYAIPWIIFLSNYLEKVGGKFILRCHFNCHNLPNIYAVVLQRRLDARSALTGKEARSHEDMMNQLVWNNTF